MSRDLPFKEHRDEAVTITATLSQYIDRNGKWNTHQDAVTVIARHLDRLAREVQEWRQPTEPARTLEEVPVRAAPPAAISGDPHVEWLASLEPQQFFEWHSRRDKNEVVGSFVATLDEIRRLRRAIKDGALERASGDREEPTK